MSKISTLHILNGDSTYNIFKNTGLGGEIAVWREALVQGPLYYQLNTEVFWNMRSQFIERAYGSKLAQYKRNVIQEFYKIKNFEGDEIILWFEYDLFCQVNMVALLSFLMKSKSDHRISLICVGKYPKRKKLLGLSEIPINDYPKLLENRKTLSRSDLATADKAWMAFCSMDKEKIYNLNAEGFDYLSDAFKASKTLFPKNGYFSEIELKILKILKKGKKKKLALIRQLLEEDQWLGLGDLQYAYIIKTLQQYLKIDDTHFRLNDKGKELLKTVEQ